MSELLNLSDTVFGVSTWPIGCDAPSSSSERFPPWRACEVEVRYPPNTRGILAALVRYPMKTRQSACDTPFCDTISKGYYAIWGGISHWAAKNPPEKPTHPDKLECRKWGFRDGDLGNSEIRGYPRKKAFFLRFLDFLGAFGPSYTLICGSPNQNSKVHKP